MEGFTDVTSALKVNQIAKERIVPGIQNNPNFMEVCPRGSLIFFCFFNTKINKEINEKLNYIRNKI